MLARISQGYYTELMATQQEIFNVRIKIDDPQGFSSFVSVASLGSLPSSPAPGACYFLADSSRYVVTDVEDLADSSDYEVVVPRVSDDSINAFIDAGGADYAQCQSIRLIMSRLAGELGIVRSNAGDESTEYTSLKAMYDFYKAMLADCESQKDKASNLRVGRYGSSKRPEIAGGNL